MANGTDFSEAPKSGKDDETSPKPSGKDETGPERIRQGRRDWSERLRQGAGRNRRQSTERSRRGYLPPSDWPRRFSSGRLCGADGAFL